MLSSIHFHQNLTLIIYTDVKKYEKIPLFDSKSPWYYSIGKQLTKFDMQCCIDVIYNHLGGIDGFKKLRRDDIKLSANTIEGITEYLDSVDVSYNIRNALHKTIIKKRNNHKTAPTLYLMINNDHVYTITNEEQKKRIRYDKLTSDKINWDIDHVAVPVQGDLNTVYNFISKLASETVNDPLLQIIIIPDLKTTDAHYIDLQVLIEEIYKRENLIIENITSKKDKVLSFSYKHTWVLFDTEYNNTKDTIEAINKDENKLFQLKYENQSLASIGMEIFQQTAAVQKSEFNNDNRKLFRMPPILRDQLVPKSVAEAQYKNIKTFDINKCHTHCLVNRDEDQYIIKMTDTLIAPPDSWQTAEADDIELPGGYYWITTTGSINLGCFDIGNGLMMRSKVVRWLLDKGFIVPKDIKGILIPSRSYSNDRMREFVNYIYSLDLETSTKKLIVNSSIGTFGKWKGSTTNVFYTTSEQTAFCLFMEEKITSFECSNNSNLILMKNSRDFELLESYRNIYHDVIIDNIVMLYNLCTALGGDRIITKAKVNQKQIVTQTEDYWGSD